MATKAVHLEAVSDMTAEAFLAAFRRFISRRGHCSHLYSDNGTNFVGAEGIMSKELRLAMRQEGFLQTLVTEGTEWHFNPPAAPHQGGLWEAAVKSTKHHLKRIIGNSTLTFEEMSTVLCQIEGCLNSRPLCIIDENPDELFVLTPAHLVNGRTMTIPPDEVDIKEDIHIGTRWKLVQKMKKDFWKIWSSEYLHNLQQRKKWNREEENMSIGDVVLIKDESLTPTKWPLARITDVHTGKDGKVRVVTVKTSQGNTYKRPITKLCHLPVSKKEADVTRNLDNGTRPRTSTNIGHLATLTYLTLAFLSIFTTCAANSYTIKNPSPGLYVEQVGEALINRGIFRIDIPINTTKLGEHEMIVNKTLRQFTDLCHKDQQLSAEIRCEKLVLDLKERYHDLQLHLKIVENGYGGRSKRGLLGQLLTSVFGVNDEIYTDISRLNENQKHLIQNSKQQTTIMIKTLTSLNATEQRISNKLNHFVEKLNHGLGQIQQLESWYRSTDENKINIHILYVYQLVNGLMEELERKYERLIRVIHHQSHIIDFLTVKEFHALIQNTTVQLPSTFQICAKQLISMDISYSPIEIMLHAYFYIVEKPTYVILNVTPIPQRVKGNIFASLSITSPLMAVDYNNQHYFELTSEEFLQGIQLGSDKGISGPRQYILAPNMMNDMNTNPSCLIDQIYGRGKDKHCDHNTFVVDSILWKKLYMPNTWMYVSTNMSRISLHCHGERQDVWLNNTGILQVTQDCTIDTDRSLLKTRTITTATGVMSFHRPIQIDVQVNHEKLPVKRLEKEPVFKTHEDFGKLLDDETLLRSNISGTVWDVIQPHVTSSSIGSIITIIIVLSVIAISIAIRRYLLRKGARASPSNDFELVAKGETHSTPLLDRPQPREPIRRTQSLFEWPRQDVPEGTEV